MEKVISPSWVFGKSWELPVRVVESSHVSVGRHGHEFYELVFVREGYCLHHLGNSVSLAMEGDILLIKPGTVHQYTGNRECKIYNCLFFRQAFEDAVWENLKKLPGIPSFLGDGPEQFPQIHLDMAERKEITRALEQMHRECEQKKVGYELRLQAWLICLLVDCARAYSAHEGGQSEKDSYSGYVTKALRYIDEHYTEETLSVEKIAEYTGISGDYLSRQFRRMAGIGAQEYVRRYRLSRALISLQQGKSVTEAALLNGFHSVGYFSREFKKEMGVTPSQYKDTYVDIIEKG